MPNSFLIDTIHFDLSTDTVTCKTSGARVELDSKSMMLLKLLALANDHKCSRDELLNQIWHDKIVSDDSLTNLVSQTRTKLKLLNAKLIKTLPKKGYVLVGDVQIEQLLDKKAIDSQNIIGVESNNSSVQSTQSTQTIAPQRRLTNKAIFIGLAITTCLGFFIGYLLLTTGANKVDRTIAILPIEAFSEAPSIINGAASFTEELTHQFANYPGIFIVSRTETAHVAANGASLAEISNILQARYLIEGSIRSTEEGVRVTVQLIDGDTGLHIFSHVIESSFSQFVKEREKIIQLVSRLVVVEMPPGMLGRHKKFDPKVLSDKCDSYSELTILYGKGILRNIDSIVQPAESACIAYAQINYGKAEAESHIARLYSVMAEGTRDAQQQKAFIYLAHTYLKKAFQSDPELLELFEIQANLNLLSIHLERQSSKNAQPLITRTLNQLQVGLELYPQSSILLSRKGITYRRLAALLSNQGVDPQNALKQAETSFEEGLEVAPDDEYLNHNLARLKKTYSEYLSKNGEDPESKLLESIKLYQRSIEIRKDDSASPYNNLANTYSSYAFWLASNNKPYQDIFLKAQDSYQQALQRSEVEHRIYNNLADLSSKIAVVNFLKGENTSVLIEKGVEYAKKALSIKQDYIWPIFNLMSLNNLAMKQDYATGKTISPYYKRCIKWGEQGLAVKNNLAEAWGQLIECEQLQVRLFLEEKQFIAAGKKLKDTQGKLAAMMKLNKNYSYSYQLQGVNQLLDNILNKTQNFSTAIQALEKSVSLNENEQTIKRSLFEAYLYQFQIDSSNQMTLGEIDDLLDTMQNDNDSSAEFELQRAIYHQLMGRKINLINFAVQLEKQHKLAGKYAVRKYQFFLHQK